MNKSLIDLLSSYGLVKDRFKVYFYPIFVECVFKVILICVISSMVKLL